jgi:hypothetical protein
VTFHAWATYHAWATFQAWVTFHVWTPLSEMRASPLVSAVCPGVGVRASYVQLLPPSPRGRETVASGRRWSLNSHCRCLQIPRAGAGLSSALAIASSLS